jgi:hypothetical protein
MKVGDLVRYLDGFWLVTRYDPKRTRTASLLNREGVALEVAHDDEAVVVVANPSEDWPFISAPVKPSMGPVASLSRSTAYADDVFELYRDWMPSEPTRAGGSIFFNPSLGLKSGDYVLARHVNGKCSGIVIPRNFSTVRQKQASVAAKVKPKEADKTAYTRLMGEDPFGDDD